MKLSYVGALISASLISLSVSASDGRELDITENESEQDYIEPRGTLVLSWVGCKWLMGHRAQLKEELHLDLPIWYFGATLHIKIC